MGGVLGCVTAESEVVVVEERQFCVKVGIERKHEWVGEGRSFSVGPMDLKFEFKERTDFEPFELAREGFRPKIGKIFGFGGR